MRHHSADINDKAIISNSTSVWNNAQIREGAVLGENCVIGSGAYIDARVKVGNNCKIQNHALVYEPAVIEDGVFIGPAAVLTNDEYPRAVNIDLSLKNAADWNLVGVKVERGASIGARAVCVAPVVIGQWALVAAGAVVTKNVPAFALVVGVPAKQIGWVGKAGIPLISIGTNKFKCPKTGTLYILYNGELNEEVS